MSLNMMHTKIEIIPQKYVFEQFNAKSYDYDTFYVYVSGTYTISKITQRLLISWKSYVKDITTSGTTYIEFVNKWLTFDQNSLCDIYEMI